MDKEIQKLEEAFKAKVGGPQNTLTLPSMAALVPHPANYLNVNLGDPHIPSLPTTPTNQRYSLKPYISHTKVGGQYPPPLQPTTPKTSSLTDHIYGKTSQFQKEQILLCSDVANFSNLVSNEMEKLAEAEALLTKIRQSTGAEKSNTFE